MTLFKGIYLYRTDISKLRDSTDVAGLFGVCMGVVGTTLWSGNGSSTTPISAGTYMRDIQRTYTLLLVVLPINRVRIVIAFIRCCCKRRLMLILINHLVVDNNWLLFRRRNILIVYASFRLSRKGHIVVLFYYKRGQILGYNRLRRIELVWNGLELSWFDGDLGFLLMRRCIGTEREDR